MKVRGIVEFYSNEGFGFIQTDHCPKKVYVNESGVHKAGYQNLRMGQIVLFNIEAPQNERRKPTAFNLEIVVPDDNYPDYRFGKVLWFNPERSFGFITPDYIGDNLYVHMVEVEGAGLKTLYKDERVRFIPYPSSRSNKLFVATYLTLLQTKVQSSQYMARVA